MKKKKVKVLIHEIKNLAEASDIISASFIIGFKQEDFFITQGISHIDINCRVLRNNKNDVFVLLLSKQKIDFNWIKKIKLFFVETYFFVCDDNINGTGGDDIYFYIDNFLTPILSLDLKEKELFFPQHLDVGKIKHIFLFNSMEDTAIKLSGFMAVS